MSLLRAQLLPSTSPSSARVASPELLATPYGLRPLLILLVVLWYASSTIHSIWLQDALRSLADARTVVIVQICILSVVLTSALTVLLTWMVDTCRTQAQSALPSAASPDSLRRHLLATAQERQVIAMGTLHFTGTALIAYTLSLTAIPCVHTFRALEPVMAALLTVATSWSAKRTVAVEQTALRAVALCMVVGGVILSVSTDQQCSNHASIALALLTNLVMVGRNSTIKGNSSQIPAMHVVSAITGLTVSALIGLLFTVRVDALLMVLRPSLAALIAASSAMAVVYHYCSLYMCCEVGLMQHSTLTLLKRPILLLLAALWYWQPPMASFIYGSLVSTCGLALYSFLPLLSKHRWKVLLVAGSCTVTALVLTFGSHPEMAALGGLSVARSSLTLAQHAPVRFQCLHDDQTIRASEYIVQAAPENMPDLTGYKALWSTAVASTGDTAFVQLQSDANLVLYAGSIGSPSAQAMWATTGHSSAVQHPYATLRANGSLAIFQAPHRLLWQTPGDSAVVSAVACVDARNNLVIYGLRAPTPQTAAAELQADKIRAPSPVAVRKPPQQIAAARPTRVCQLYPMKVEPTASFAVQLDQTGANFGNVVWNEAANRLLDHAKVTAVSIYSDEELPQCDAVLFPQANLLRNQTGHLPQSLIKHIEKYNRILAKINRPTLAIGLGSSASLQPSNEPLFTDLAPGFQLLAEPQRERFPEAVMELMRIVGSLSRWIFVRGRYTEAACHHQGISQARAVGCPSLLLNRDSTLGQQLQDRYQALAARMDDPTFRFVLTFPPYPAMTAPRTWALMLHVLARYPDSVCIIQDQGDVDYLERARTEIPNIDGSVIDRAQKQQRFFTSFDEWRTLVANYDAVFGWRIHGAMVGIAAAVPTFLMCPDMRVLELAEAMHLPHTMPNDPRLSAPDFDALRFMAAVDFNVTAFDSHRQLAADMYVQALRLARIPPADDLVELANGAAVVQKAGDVQSTQVRNETAA